LLIRFAVRLHSFCAVYDFTVVGSDSISLGSGAFVSVPLLLDGYDCPGLFYYRIRCSVVLFVPCSRSWMARYVLFVLRCAAVASLAIWLLFVLICCCWCHCYRCRLLRLMELCVVGFFRCLDAVLVALLLGDGCCLLLRCHFVARWVLLVVALLFYWMPLPGFIYRLFCGFGGCRCCSTRGDALLRWNAFSPWRMRSLPLPFIFVCLVL